MHISTPLHSIQHQVVLGFPLLTLRHFPDCYYPVTIKVTMEHWRPQAPAGHLTAYKWVSFQKGYVVHSSAEYDIKNTTVALQVVRSS